MARRQPGLLGGGGGGGGGELGGHPRLHVVSRHARGGHGGLEVALFRCTDKLKKENTQKKVAFLLPLPLAAAAAAAAKTHVFVKDGGGGALEEVSEAIAEPPPSSLVLVVGAFFEPGELSTRELGG